MLKGHFFKKNFFFNLIQVDKPTPYFLLIFLKGVFAAISERTIQYSVIYCCLVFLCLPIRV